MSTFSLSDPVRNDVRKRFIGEYYKAETLVTAMLAMEDPSEILAACAPLLEAVVSFILRYDWLADAFC